MTPDLRKLLADMNAALRRGRPRAEVDAYLQNTYQITYADLVKEARRLPAAKPEVKPLTEWDVVKMEAYAASLGWFDEMAGLWGALKGTGFEKARDAMRQEIAQIRKDYPTEAWSAMAIGGAIPGVLATAGAGAALGAVAEPVGAAVGLGATPGAVSAAGAGAGALAGALGGAGGLGGETEGMGRLLPALTGGAGGAVLGGAGGVVASNPTARRLLVKGVLGGAGLGSGLGLLEYFMH
jgi:hypothetical protein